MSLNKIAERQAVKAQSKPEHPVSKKTAPNSSEQPQSPQRASQRFVPTCSECPNLIAPDPKTGRVRTGRLTCSCACADTRKLRLDRERYQPKAKKTRRSDLPEKRCPVCGKMFGPKPKESASQYQARQTCSRVCSGRWASAKYLSPVQPLNREQEIQMKLDQLEKLEREGDAAVRALVRERRERLEAERWALRRAA